MRGRKGRLEIDIIHEVTQMACCDDNCGCNDKEDSGCGDDCSCGGDCDCNKVALLVGKIAPEFEGPAWGKIYGGENLGHVGSPDFKGKWLVLFFYPAAFTGICGSEVAAFSQEYARFKALNAEPLGVSVDTQFSLKKWAESGEVGEVPFRLLADNTHKTGRAFGVYDKEIGLHFRGLFIIDPEGHLRYQVVQEPFIGRSTEETLRVLAALQSGEACPANWKPKKI